VVIASHNAKPVIAVCLSALASQLDPQLDEIIVADSSDDGTEKAAREALPGLRLLHFDAPLTLPQLRGHGIAAAGGEIIAILDPYSIASPGWSAALLQAHREHPHPVIGGTVDLYDEERQGLLAWAQYINEYGMFMSPAATGEIEILPGSNISYKRSVLFDGPAPRFTEFWKTFVNWEAETAGLRLWLAPAVHVRLWKPIPFGDFLRTRRDHGRCFGALRSQHATRFERLLRAASTPLLPWLFLQRWGRRYLARKRRRREFLLTLPLQLLLFAQWALGEFAGYCFGPSRSCQNLFY
jgi:glycosyltransferase involved in cell wall biosynthesis